MSDSENPELERRLAALEKGSARAPKTAPRRSPLLALAVVGIIGAGGALLFLLSQPEEEVALPTATPDVFQSEGDGFGAIETLPPPEPEVVFVAPDPAEPNAELLAQITALQVRHRGREKGPRGWGMARWAAQVTSRNQHVLPLRPLTHPLVLDFPPHPRSPP